jgi:hypothetical protein
MQAGAWALRLVALHAPAHSAPACIANQVHNGNVDMHVFARCYFIDSTGDRRLNSNNCVETLPEFCEKIPSASLSFK